MWSFHINHIHMWSSVWQKQFAGAVNSYNSPKIAVLASFCTVWFALIPSHHSTRISQYTGKSFFGSVKIVLSQSCLTPPYQNVYTDIFVTFCTCVDTVSLRLIENPPDNFSTFRNFKVFVMQMGHKYMAQ